MSEVIFDQILTRWVEILHRVKEKKITAQAWLLAGKPVWVEGNTLILSFLSTIHRETVMKNIHRKVIEDTISEVIGDDIKIEAIMESELRSNNALILDLVRESWQDILERVKSKKLTTQAWLLAGTPTEFDSNTLSISYKSPIHVSTVMNGIHKPVIEEVISSFVNKKIRISALLDDSNRLLNTEKIQEIDEVIGTLETVPIEDNPNILRSDNLDSRKIKKLFISHSSKDSKYVGAMIELLESFGLREGQIFCSSFEPYGIPLGENFLERIKKELNDETLVLFILSNNFYDSPVCLCEMGATWILSSQHIPVLIPPFAFSMIRGVIPLTQGLLANDREKLNSFKDYILSIFGLKELNSNVWERKRKNFIDTIEALTEENVEIPNLVASEKSDASYVEISETFDGFGLLDYINSAHVLHDYRHGLIKHRDQQSSASMFIKMCRDNFQARATFDASNYMVSGTRFAHMIDGLNESGLGVFVKFDVSDQYGRRELTIAIASLDNPDVYGDLQERKLRILQDKFQNYSISHY